MFAVDLDRDMVAGTEEEQEEDVKEISLDGRLGVPDLSFISG